MSIYFIITIFLISLFSYITSLQVPLYSTPQDWIHSYYAKDNFFLALSSNYNPYISLYIGTPPQQTNLSFTFSSPSTWITNSYFTNNQNNENFNSQFSSSYEKDESKQIAYSYKLNPFSNYISFDYISLVKNSEHSLQKKYQFILQQQTQSTIDEMFYKQGGQLGLNYTHSENDNFLEQSTNPHFSLSNYFWLNNLKENKIIQHRSIGFQFNAINGTAYIGEKLNLTVSNVSLCSNNSLRIPLNRITINDESIKVSLLDVSLELSFDQNYIFAYGKQAQKLFNTISFKLNTFCKVESNQNNYKGIVCNKSKKSEIFKNFTGIKFAFGEGEKNEISFLPSDMFVIKDDIMVFKIVFQFDYVNVPWVFGTMLFESNIVMLDYDLNMFSIGKIVDNEKKLNPYEPNKPTPEIENPFMNDDIGSISKPIIIPLPNYPNKKGNKTKQKGYCGITILLSLVGSIYIIISKYMRSKNAVRTDIIPSLE